MAVGAEEVDADCDDYYGHGYGYHHVDPVH